MGRKSTQLQIRVTSEQKLALKRLASQAGLSVPAYVLADLLPSKRLEFNRSTLALKGGTDRPGALSDIQ
jgi:hypothetical protein